MKFTFTHPTRLLALAALSGSIFLSACGGGGGGTPTPAGPPIINNGSLPNVAEGVISGTAAGTSTGTITGTASGTSSGAISGTSVGLINGTVTGTVTQSVSGSVTTSNVTNTPVASSGVATVTGTVNGVVVGTVIGTVVGTTTGTVTGTVTGVVQGTATGTLTPVAVSALSAQQAAQGFLAAYDTHRATFRSAGSDYWSMHDACILTNGRSKAMLVSDWDASTDKQARTAFDIGSLSANTPVTVLAERNSANADGTTRRELDIEYSVVYTDGTRDNTATSTIVSGSSSGARNADGTACTTPENKAAWRFKGNDRIIDFGFARFNRDTARVFLSSGLDRTPDTNYDRYIELRLRDPANVATYYTVSGPGLKDGGNTGTLATLIAMSPRLLRDDPLFAGKVGNANYLNTDSFRFCRVAANNGTFAAASAGNCSTAGVGGTAFGSSGFGTEAAADTNFDAFGFVVNGSYEVKVYAGDGWKSAVGIASATPIATYTYTLETLPYPAVSLRPASGSLYADFNATVTSVVSASTTGAIIAKQIRDKTTFTVNTGWNTMPLTMPDGTKATTTEIGYFVQGPAVGAAAGSAWPRNRQYFPYFPAPGATSLSISQPALSTNLGTATYGEVFLYMNNRNGNTIATGAVFD